MGAINNAFNQAAGAVAGAALAIKHAKETEESKMYTAENAALVAKNQASTAEAERSALKDKMKYNGMTIMKIGKLTDYLLGEDKFYKGQLIRLNIKVDSHMAYEIYNELNKGVYL